MQRLPCSFAMMPQTSLTMQASWGMENEAPTPCRTGELYGEKGTWYVPNTCSIQDVYTRADPGVRGADDPATKFKVKEYVHEGEVQKHTAKFASEQDLQPIGLHAGFFAHPDKMTMVRASNAGWHRSALSGWWWWME